MPIKKQLFPELKKLGLKKDNLKNLPKNFNKETIYRIVQVNKSTFIAKNLQRIISLKTPLNFKNLNLENVAIGDFIIVDLKNKLTFILDRYSKLTRLLKYKRNRQQIMAANLDICFIVTSFNKDFNLARVKRYIAFVKNALIKPIILITKKDLVEDQVMYLKQLEQLNQIKNIPVVFLNAKNKKDVYLLFDYLTTGICACFIGSSGVGKSTIIANLTNQTIKTNNISIKTDKGKHTTTARKLYFLQNFASVIDMPGIKEVDFLILNKEDTFKEIIDLAKDCKFNNCDHEKSFGCAIKEGVLNGKIQKIDWQNYLKLTKNKS